MPLPTAEYVRSALDYDPETGEFRWKTSGKGRRKNGRAGYTDSSTGRRYIRVKFGEEKWLRAAHQYAWLYMTGEWPTKDIDHWDGNPGNNAWGNLREATESQNLANRSAQKNNTSGFKGVCWTKNANRWRAKIKVEGKHIHLGLFDDPEDAARAYDAAAVAHFGEFACHNGLGG